LTTRQLAVVLLASLAACSTRAPSRRTTEPEPDRGYADRTVRVALPAPSAYISATADFEWFAADGRTQLTALRRDLWHMERDNGRVRAVRDDGQVSLPWNAGLVARTYGNGLITVNGRRYRGDVLIVSGDSDLLVVNRVPLETYVRSVVGKEMGDRSRQELAAVQAQAVASRSFAIARMGSARTYDLRATTQDQVYGGMESENDVATEATHSTRGEVLLFNGHVADAPFHSACGGTTATPAEAWGTTNTASYLQQVSDRIPNSDRFYCDIAPQYHWTRSLDAVRLNAALDRYLASYAGASARNPGAARVVAIKERTSSGRVSVLEIETDRGIFPVRGDNIRYVLREPGGEILRSTYFSVEPEYGRDGHVAKVTLRGQGNGHGVGMCQWGAIGRARAGQPYRTILRTYYPGTTVGFAPAQ
jgi:stage II sporulation protein D